MVESVTFNMQGGETALQIHHVIAKAYDDAIEILDGKGLSPRGERCCHSYDCCGNWYRGPVCLLKEMEYNDDDYLFIFEQYIRLNV